MTDLMEKLQSLQTEILSIVRPLSDIEFKQQYHPDLSPVGWHLGHCVYTETYWIREQLLNLSPLKETLRELYVPEMIDKKKRGGLLSKKTELINWAKEKQAENRMLLNAYFNEKKTNELMENDYLIHFLIQHYSQHIETVLIIMTEMQLVKKEKPNREIESLDAGTIHPDTITIPAGQYFIGSKTKHSPYDNEHPEQEVSIEEFNIAIHPVSNSEYLFFMKEGGYTTPAYWSDKAWTWRNKNNIEHPHHWRFHNGWFGIDRNGPYTLKPDDAVFGLSYYEASAFAKWAGARLPHEYEWEVADKKKMLNQTLLAWEWCNNTFHPYPGFVAYPYSGYSTPYFDGAHYVLKGASCLSKPFIKRPSFRNYYTADKRHIYAGVRLVY